MTVVIAIAVNPVKDQMPHFFIASESKRVLKQEDKGGNGVYTQYCR